MHTTQTRFRALAPLAMALVLATQASAGAATTDSGFILTKHRADPTQVDKPLAVVELDNGDDIAFSPILDKDGVATAVVVTGVRSPDRGPTAAVEGLAGANPLELFVALSRPGAKVPATLGDLYGASSHLKQQGWARDLVLKAPPSAATCPAVYWSNQLDAYGDLFDDDPFKSIWDGPGTQPSHWASFMPGDGHIYYELNGQAEDVTSFYGSVLYCAQGSEPTSFGGVPVSSFYRVAGTGTWHTSGQLTLDSVGDIYEHIYVGGTGPSAPTYDFRVMIHGATAGDQFHIGATWRTGRPSDYRALS